MTVSSMFERLRGCRQIASAAKRPLNLAGVARVSAQLPTGSLDTARNDCSHARSTCSSDWCTVGNGVDAVHAYTESERDRKWIQFRQYLIVANNAGMGNS
jgi:hypothetical protein